MNEHVAFKDAKGVRHTWPAAHTGVSETPHDDGGAADGDQCIAHFGGKMVPVPMSYGAFRRLLGVTS